MFEVKNESDSAQPDNYVVLKQYVNPSMYAIMILFGLVWNGVLMLIFLRHKDMRTTPNIMIFNLTICDLLKICISGPILCIYHFPHNSPGNVLWCRLHIMIRHFLISASAFSVLALSIQRFCATFPFFQLDLDPCRRKIFTSLYVSLLWVGALAFGSPACITESVYSYLCGSSQYTYATSVLLLVIAIIYCIILPGIMIFFSVWTAWRLRKSVKHIPCDLPPRDQDRVRLRSANIVTSLAVLFFVSHVPFWIWSVTVYWTFPDRNSLWVVIGEYVCKYLVFWDSCLNPVALYMVSGKFRNLFKRYFLCSFMRTRERTYVNTGSSFVVSRTRSSISVGRQLSPETLVG